MPSARPAPEPNEVVEVSLGIVLRRETGGSCNSPLNEVLISRRLAGSVLAGWWELPGGKIDPGETPDDCAIRELREEVGVAAEVLDALPVVEHTYAHGRVRLHPRLCRLTAGSPEPRAIEVAEVRWIRVGDLGAYRFPAGNDAVVAAMRDRLARP